jgi:hypothetical protein
MIFMKKLLFSILVSSLFLFQLAFAADFSLSYDKDGTKLDIQQLANYPFYATKTGYITVTISNPLPESWFTMTVWGVPQDWVTVDNENSLISVPSMRSGSVKVQVKPSRDAIPNIYQYFLKVTNLNTKEEIETPLLINVIQVTSAIMQDVSLSCKSCVDAVNVSGKIINVGSKNLDLSLIFKYGNNQKTLNVGKLETGARKEFETTVSLKDMEPKSYNMDVMLVDASGNVFYIESAAFSIPAIDNVVYSKKVASTPFGSSVTVTATNMGNVVSEADLKSVSPSNWYSVISGPSPTGMMTGYYVWTKSLSPRESITLGYSEIYWPSYVLIVAIVGMLLFFYWQSSAFTFTKNIMSKTAMRSGKDISISLNLKSKRKSIDRVAIKDTIPSNFSIVSNFETVKPLIRKVTEGVELIWKLGGLNPNEERVLHYTIRPNTELSHKVNLPAALAKAGNSLKRSNKVALAPEKESTRTVSVRVAK